MKNINFKFITVLGVGAILLSLGACSSSGKSDTQGSSTSSVNTSVSEEDLLIEDSMEELLDAIYNDDFDTFINLLDESNYKIYMESDMEQQNEYKEKFFLINQKLKEFYTQNWIKLVNFDDIDYFNAIDYKGGNIDTYIESDFIYELDFRKENGRYVLRNG